MEKRLILAIALSLLVLLTWSAIAPKPQPVANKEVITKNTASVNISPTKSTAVVAGEDSLPTSIVQYAQDRFDVVFIEQQAAIKEVLFKTYQGYKFNLKYGFLLGDNSLSFQKESSSSEGVTFVYSDSTKRIRKKFVFLNSNYTIELYIETQNLSNSPLKINLPLVLGVQDFSSQNIQARFQDVTVASKDKALHSSKVTA